MIQTQIKIGEKYNKLTIIDILLDNKNKEKHKVRCICDCGTECIRNLRCVKRGLSKSCGCLSIQWQKSSEFKEMQKKSSKLGADATRLPTGISSFNKIFQVYQSGARKRRLSFELTKSEFTTLINDNCFYCGITPSQRTFDKKRNGNYVYNGIDRVDNSIGYNINNCVTCCGICNKMKMGETQEFFLKKIIMIYKKHYKGQE